MAEPLKFNRIVLGLPHYRPSHGMQFATELARLLQLDLFGLFVQEESLFGIASLPFVREFKFLGGGWRPLDAAQLSRDMEIAAKSAERAFADAAKTLRTTCQFEVVRGSMAETIVSVSRINDIVLLTEPTNSAEYVTPQFFALLEAAMQSAAAVLLVPGRVARHSGAIVAIATGPDDSSIDAARTIAAAAKEELVVVEAFNSAGKNDIFAALPSGEPRVRRIALGGGGSVLPAIESALRPLRERLVVMTRSHDYSPLAIASMRHVPVLIVEPPKRKVQNNDTSRLTK